MAHFQLLTSSQVVTEVSNIRSALAKCSRPMLQTHRPPPPRVAPTPSPYSRSYEARVLWESGNLFPDHDKLHGALWLTSLP